jgi:hypothetical protein
MIKPSSSRRRDVLGELLGREVAIRARLTGCASSTLSGAGRFCTRNGVDGGDEGWEMTSFGFFAGFGRGLGSIMPGPSVE